MVAMFANRHTNCTHLSFRIHFENLSPLEQQKRIALHIRRRSRMSVCAFVCVIQTLSLRLSHHPFTLSLVQQKANMSVNPRRRIGFTPNSEQIKTTEGGIAHILCNTHAINHISFSHTHKPTMALLYLLLPWRHHEKVRVLRLGTMIG